MLRNLENLSFALNLSLRSFGTTNFLYFNQSETYIIPLNTTIFYPVYTDSISLFYCLRSRTDTLINPILRLPHSRDSQLHSHQNDFALNKESPPVHPIPEASLGVLRTDSHALRAGRRLENKTNTKNKIKADPRGGEFSQ